LTQAVVEARSAVPLSGSVTENPQLRSTSLPRPSRCAEPVAPIDQLSVDRCRRSPPPVRGFGARTRSTGPEKPQTAREHRRGHPGEHQRVFGRPRAIWAPVVALPAPRGGCRCGSQGPDPEQALRSPRRPVSTVAATGGAPAGVRSSTGHLGASSGTSRTPRWLPVQRQRAELRPRGSALEPWCSGVIRHKRKPLK